MRSTRLSLRVVCTSVALDWHYLGRDLVRTVAARNKLLAERSRRIWVKEQDFPSHALF